MRGDLWWKLYPCPSVGNGAAHRCTLPVHYSTPPSVRVRDAGMTSGKWAGRTVTNARRPWLPRIAAGDVTCARCGLPIAPDQAWHLGHQQDRALGGGHEPSNLHPEHVRCSTSAGGRLGHALRTNVIRMVPNVSTRRSWTP